jgi:hypothetical protein
MVRFSKIINTYIHLNVKDKYQEEGFMIHKLKKFSKKIRPSAFCDDEKE